MRTKAKRLPMLLAATGSVLVMTNANADINVGVIFSLTGPAASLGAETNKAVALMPRELNGEKLNFIVLDDATDPSIAVKNARKLIHENKVDVLFGPNLTTSAMALVDVANEEKVAMLSQAPISIAPDKLSWVFRVDPTPDVMVGRVVKDMQAQGIRTVAFIGFADSWGELLLNALNRSADGAGIKVLTAERYARTDTSVTGQALKIIASRPDAVFVGGSGTPAALPQSALRERGYKGPIYQSHAVANKDFLRVGGKGVEGARLPVGPVLVAEQLPDTHPNKQPGLAFLKALEAKFDNNSRSAFAANSWDGWLILQSALMSAMGTAKPGTSQFREAVRDSLEKTNKLVGVNGIYSMSPTDHGGYDPAVPVLVEVKEGVWKIVN